MLLLSRVYMKRIGNLYQQIYDLDNLILADTKASKGKSKNKDVISHRLNKSENILILHDMLKHKTYKTSQYKKFVIYEPKERIISKLPYFPDRICHHAILNILEPYFNKWFTNDTYSSIKNRGIHLASKRVKTALKDQTATKYCLKLDIQKFYPSIDHDVLKHLLSNKFKDKDVLWLFDVIIDSTDGVPIGNYLSQYFANFYLTKFDHFVKQDLKVKYYFRYADDMVILSDNKQFLHKVLNEITIYLKDNLKLNIKKNYQIYPVSSRGIDFVGYKHYHTHTLLRPSIKHNFVKMLLKNPNQKSIDSYLGWFKHCNSKNLINKLIHEKL